MEQPNKRKRERVAKKSSTKLRATTISNTKATAPLVEGRVLRSRKRVEEAPPPSPPLSPSPSPPTSTRIQQPNVYINRNLMKIKMEVDYIPKVEPVETDEITRGFENSASYSKKIKIEDTKQPKKENSQENKGQEPEFSGFQASGYENIAVKEEQEEKETETEAGKGTQVFSANEELLLPLILAHSTPADLLQHRLVSQQWKKVATQTLLAKGSLKIRFQLNKDTYSSTVTDDDIFYSLAQAEKVIPTGLCLEHKRPKNNQFWDLIGDRTLSGLLHILNPKNVSSSLPATHFDFNVKEFVQHAIPQQLASFLEYCGPKITALTLDDHTPSNFSTKGINNFILRHTPNLQSLTLLDRWSQVPHSYSRVPAIPKFSLEHLTCIQIAADEEKLKYRCGHFSHASTTASKFLPYLFAMAPQLKRLTLTHFGKPLLLKNLPPSKINLLEIQSLTLTDLELFSDNLNDLENFIEVMEQSSKGVGLRRLKICVGNWPPDLTSWRRGCLALRQLFGANVDSLREIELLSGAAVCLYRMRGLPSLPNVMKLSVRFDLDHPFDKVTSWGGVIKRDVPSNSLPLLFPSLETLKVRMWEHGLRAKTMFLPWNDKLKRVKTLDINFFEATIMDRCPEVTHLRCCAFSEDFALLWNYTKLTNLTLDVEIGWADDPSHVEVDAAITGMSEETVSAIYNHWQKCGRWEHNIVEAMATGSPDENPPVPRVNPSILNMINLKKLQLNFFPQHYSRGEQFISAVSAQFGFGLLENLEVRITFKVGDSSSGLELPECSECDREPVAKKRAELLQLHHPLSFFPNVTLDIE